jgi:UDPglucose 6-dehydrogenase
MNISVIGLGKLGLCTAACFAVKGHTVVGMDKNPYFIDELMHKRCLIDETGLEELLKGGWGNFRVTMSIKDAVLDSDITLVIVPTPSEADGRFTNRYVEDVLKSLGTILKGKETFHIVNVVSTVMPGSSDQYFKPLLEQLSGKVCGKDFGLVYNPEFIALGSVIKNFLNPDMVLIGASDEYSGNVVKELYQTTCESSPDIAVMSLINAEITKISLNCFVTMKISYVNELASICEQVPGADIDEITKAMGADTRIGSKYLKGGLGFGGPCFPRDNIAFQAFAREVGMEARLGTQVVTINNLVVDRIYKIIATHIQAGEKIALLGLSYKPNTHIIEESQSIILAKKLMENGYLLTVHDPKAINECKSIMSGKIKYSEDVYSCVEEASAVILLTNWSIYQQLDWDRISGIVKNDALLLDSWRILKKSENTKNNYYYIGLGLGDYRN